MGMKNNTNSTANASESYQFVESRGEIDYRATSKTGNTDRNGRAQS